MNNLKYPIGQQNFENIRKDGFVYVDKTELIYNLVHQNKFVFLSRPRRFGKSLLLSTIQAYFEGKKDLFKGLAIEGLEMDWKRHPVLHLELSRHNSLDPNSLYYTIGQQFSLWEDSLGILPSAEVDLGTRFSSIVIESFKKEGAKVVILVDEYDNPLVNTLHSPKIHNSNRELLKSIYTNLKALDEYIQFAMLTGVSRFSRMNVFSGLNNLNDISLLDKYASICGITEEEIRSQLSEGVENLAKVYEENYGQSLQRLKRSYDGYHFSKNCPDLYNPFSLLTALHNEEINSYWYFTGTPTFLIERLKSSGVLLSDFLNSKVLGKSLADSDISSTSTLALLYQTGYLTIKSYNRETEKYTLGVPNKEVEEGLFSQLATIFSGGEKDLTMLSIDKIADYAEEGEAEKLMKSLQSFMASIPYTVTGKAKEILFENNIYIIFKLLGIKTSAEVTTSDGRIDILLETKRFYYIIELKLNQPAQKALDQINRKEYDMPFKFDGKKIIKIGVRVSSRTRKITEWKINKIDSGSGSNG